MQTETAQRALSQGGPVPAPGSSMTSVRAGGVRIKLTRNKPSLSSSPLLAGGPVDKQTQLPGVLMVE